MGARRVLLAWAVVRAEGYTHAESMRVLSQGPRPSGLLRQCRHRLLRSCASQELPGSNAKPESMRKGGAEGCLERQPSESFTTLRAEIQAALQGCDPEVLLQTPKPRKIQRHKKVTQK